VEVPSSSPLLIKQRQVDIPAREGMLACCIVNPVCNISAVQLKSSLSKGKLYYFYLSPIAECRAGIWDI